MNESRSKLEQKLAAIRQNLDVPEEDAHHDHQDFDYTSIGRYRQLLRSELEEKGVKLRVDVENVQTEADNHILTASVTAADIDTGSQVHLGSAATRSKVSSRTPVRAARSKAVKSVLIDEFWPETRESENAEQVQNSKNTSNSGKNAESDPAEDYRSYDTDDNSCSEGQVKAIFAVAGKLADDKYDVIDPVCDAVGKDKVKSFSAQEAARVIDHLDEDGLDALEDPHFPNPPAWNPNQGPSGGQGGQKGEGFDPEKAMSALIDKAGSPDELNKFIQAAYPPGDRCREVSAGNPSTLTRELANDIWSSLKNTKAKV